MKVVYDHSHLGGKQILSSDFPSMKREILEIIASIKDPGKTKLSKEKTKTGKMLYAPALLNKLFDKAFRERGWDKKRDYFNIELPGYDVKINGAFKETDYVKGPIGAEVQFGKYAFMLYDLLKFQYLYMNGFIKVGIEIVPCKRLQRDMSTGVSFGEQLVSDLIRMQAVFPSCSIWVILVDF